MPELTCIDCAKTHPASASRCSCGGALDEPDPILTPGEHALGHRPVEGRRGLWRHREAIGVQPEHVVTLGEGDTPLVHDDELGCHLKLEHLNPTGSFKDRGATVTASVARALGAEHLTEDSSGNAGAATAAYAAAAGMACTIYSPSFLHPAKRARMEALGATVQIVDGPRAGVTEAAAEHGARGGCYYANHTYPPHFLKGCATLAFELVRDLDGPPDVLITPCAMGSVLLGCHRGFQGLARAGMLDELPRLVAVQAAGYDPIVQALDGPRATGEDNEVADGLLIPEPPRGAQIVQAVQATGGTAISIGAKATEQAMGRLHRRGLLVEPSSAVTLAAFDQLREVGELRRGERAVLVLTGGWKG